MELYIGGTAQGKLAYVERNLQSRTPAVQYRIWDAAEQALENAPENAMEHAAEGLTGEKLPTEEVLLVNHFHLYVRKLLEREWCSVDSAAQGTELDLSQQCVKLPQHCVNPRQMEDVVRSLVSAVPTIVLICDEVGNGIVPMEKKEREYRERLGRILIELAKQATHVERIICGLGQVLK